MLKIVFLTFTSLYLIAIICLPFYLVDTSSMEESKMLFKEGSIVEVTQSLQLLVATLLFGLATREHFKAGKSLRWLSLLLLLGIAWACVRESDSLMGKLDLLGAYYAMRYGLLAGAILLIVRHRHAIWAKWIKATKRMDMHFFHIGVSFYIAAQVVGGIISHSGGDRALKRITEEGFELVGGGLILVASVRFLLSANSYLRHCWHRHDEAGRLAFEANE